ncbi:MAG: AI-2E family transporter [Pseudohongiellaceae bacterium]
MNKESITTPISIALFWAVSLVLFGLFIWLFRGVLTPFVLGMTIAYLLNPVVIWLEKLKLSRTLAVLALLTLFFLTITVLLLLLIPPLYRELMQLAEQAPAYLQALIERLQPYLNLAQQEIAEQNLDQNILATLQNNVSNAFNFGSGVMSGLLTGGQAIIGFLSLLILTPLVAFYMMREWKALTGTIDELIPRHNYDEIKNLLNQIDGKISGFVRGQLLVALLLGILYAVALSIAGLDFGILIGLTAGFLSIIPLFGSAVGLVVSIAVAWFQATEITYVLTIAAIFIVGQLLEGNVITPKLLGGSVGMHPLWILFSIMAGALLFGILGMMIAVPVAAALGVLLSFALHRYKASSYYK